MVFYDEIKNLVENNLEHWQEYLCEENNYESQLTIGLTITEDTVDNSWSYQTGDNSFVGGAYGHPDWIVVYFNKDSDVMDLMEQYAEEYDNILY
tara:strand:- start:100 stop:381 length:282 start_codon:yes stop_codon:yes gene_type:complete